MDGTATVTGERVGGWPQGQPRPFFCRSCNKRETAVMVPRGWYTLTRHTGTLDEPPLRLGTYCSAQCLSDQMARVTAQEKVL